MKGSQSSLGVSEGFGQSTFNMNNVGHVRQWFRRGVDNTRYILAGSLIEANTD